MATLPRDVAQMLVTKMDLNAITPTDAKAHASRYGVTLTGRTREQVVRSIGQQMEPKP